VIFDHPAIRAAIQRRGRRGTAGSGRTGHACGARAAVVPPRPAAPVVPPRPAVPIVPPFPSFPLSPSSRRARPRLSCRRRPSCPRTLRRCCRPLRCRSSRRCPSRRSPRFRPCRWFPRLPIRFRQPPLSRRSRWSRRSRLSGNCRHFRCPSARFRHHSRGHSRRPGPRRIPRQRTKCGSCTVYVGVRAFPWLPQPARWSAVTAGICAGNDKKAQKPRRTNDVVSVRALIRGCM
jgi:hypothetical protein